MSRKRNQRSARAKSGEARNVEYLTVAWMLAVMTALVCELGSAAAHWYVLEHPTAAMVELLSNVLLFAALVIGFFALLATAVVVRARRTPPPRGVLVFAIVVSAAPMLVILLQVAGS